MRRYANRGARGLVRDSLGALSGPPGAAEVVKCAGPFRGTWWHPRQPLEREVTVSDLMREATPFAPDSWNSIRTHRLTA